MATILAKDLIHFSISIEMATFMHLLFSFMYISVSVHMENMELQKKCSVHGKGKQNYNCSFMMMWMDGMFVTINY